MQPTNNNITNTHQDLNIANISPNIDVNIQQSSDITSINSESLNLPINNRQVSNSNAIANCNKKYTASEFLDLLQNNKLPNHPITVIADIEIYENTEITHLPKNLTVIGTLKITRCPNIKSIPSGLKAIKLMVMQCENMIEFAENVEVDTLFIHHCPRLPILNNLTVNKNLELLKCGTVTKLPILGNQIQDISISSVDAIALPDNLTTSGNVTLSECLETIDLGENMNIGGNFFITNVQCFIKLPDNLKVASNLTLIGHHEITSLGENMNIGGDFYIMGLEKLTKLPNNLKVHGDIKVYSCHNLRFLPTIWLEDMPNNLPVTADNHHSISFRDTGISLEEINNYNDNTPIYVNFFPSSSELSLERLIWLWQAKILHNDTITITNITNEEREDLRQFLSKLTKTASAINTNTNKYLAEQVINILKLIANNTEIKERALLIINNSVSECEDRVSLGLTELEFLPLLFTAEQQAKTDKQGSELLAVAKQKLLIDEIKQYAMMHAAKNNASAEEVEFILAYTIKLASYFSLPITVKEMKHEDMANISNTNIDIAYAVINTKVTDEYFRQWLTNWGPWQKHTRRWSIKPYTALTSKRISKDDIASDSLCIISQDSLADITDPVYYNNQLYSYASLCEWYIEKGTNPVNPSETIHLDEIYSLQIDETDNGDITAKRRKII